MKATVIPCALALFFSVPAIADSGFTPEQTAAVMRELTEGVARTDPTTEGDVLAMMARVPGRPGDPRSGAYRWDRKRGAAAVARAIAAAAPTRTWAARMVVYAIHESGLTLEPCASGDGGKSLGPWQLQGLPERVACDPVKSSRIWLMFAETSEAHCALLPESERMAELVSGSCARGHQLARRREVLVLGALEAAGRE